MHTRLSGLLLLASASGLLPLAAADTCPFAKRGDANPHIKREESESFGRCSVSSNAAGGGTRSSDWWPCQLRLDVLRQFSAETNPLGGDFDYVSTLDSLDCKLLWTPMGSIYIVLTCLF